MEVASGVVVTLEYTVRLESGTPVDSTSGCGPLSILYGAGQLFPALEDRIAGMRPGETRTLRIPAEDAYGPHDPSLVRRIPRDRLPPDLELTIGAEYRLKGADGVTLRFRVVDIAPDAVRADFNAPHAGEALLATVTVVAVRQPSPEEARRGRV
jgi:peptidylprolyl isomerase